MWAQVTHSLTMPLTRWWKWQSQSRALEFSEKWRMEKYLFKRKNSPSMGKEKADNILLTTFSQLFFLSMRHSLSGRWGTVKIQTYLWTLVAVSHPGIFGNHYHPIPNSLWCLRGLGLDSAWEFSYGERIPKVEGRRMVGISIRCCFLQQSHTGARKSPDSNEKHICDLQEWPHSMPIG